MLSEDSCPKEKSHNFQLAGKRNLESPLNPFSPSLKEQAAEELRDTYRMYSRRRFYSEIPGEQAGLRKNFCCPSSQRDSSSSRSREKRQISPSDSLNRI